MVFGRDSYLPQPSSPLLPLPPSSSSSSSNSSTSFNGFQIIWPGQKVNLVKKDFRVAWDESQGMCLAHAGRTPASQGPDRQ